MTTPKHSILYEPLDTILVRAPLLPCEAYGRDAPPKARREWIEPAIMVASQSLARARADEKSAASRLRYRIRMTTRPTPYGLFSGVNLASWGERTTLALADAPPLTASRPDMGWLLRLVMDLEARRDIRSGLRVRANTAAFVRGGRIVLAERLSHDGDGGTPPRVSVRATAATLLALRTARVPAAVPDLIRIVSEAAPTVTLARVEGLIHNLIDESLLITDLRPPLTSASPVDWVLARLARIPAAADIYAQLAEFVRGAREWDGLPASARGGAYRALAQSAAALGAKPDEPPLQVDTIFPLDGTKIARAVGEEVAVAASLMLRMTPVPYGFSYLRAYHQAFVARYGQHREVPLLEMLDSHWGLGPPDIAAGSAWAQFPTRDEALLELACRAQRERSLVVELDEAAISRLETRRHDPGPLPASLDVCAFVCAEPGGIDRGAFKVVIGPNVGSLGAGRNVGRFATALGAEAQAALRRAREGDRTDALVAEIVYLPHKFRLTNVAIRPVTSGHEVTLGVSPGVAPDREIPLDELVVGADERRFYLRWPGHAERVVITNSHMLNFNEAHPICRFLAHVDADEKAQLHVFDWGPASSFAFLPRVEMGRIVLRPAQWRIGCTDAAQCATPQAFGEFLEGQRRDLMLPRYIYLARGDVRLLLDLDDPGHAEQLRHALRRIAPGRKLFLQEALPALEDAWLPGPGGHYVAELVVSLARSAESGEDSASPPPRCEQLQAIPRMIPPGGSWLFLKLYGSSDNEEDLLSGPFAAFLEEARKAGLFQDWFFLRYSDPQDHLRIRFRTPEPEDTEALLTELCAFGGSLMAHDLCSRFVFDTYEREIERYGGAEAMEAAEALFAADSDLVLAMMRLLKESELERKSLVAFSALDLLDGLSLRATQVADLTAKLRPFWLEAGPLYRTAKAAFLPLVEEPARLMQEPGGGEVLQVLAQRREAAEEIGRRLTGLESRAALTSPLIDIWHSFLHMHCNRALGRDRTEERLVLGLMLRGRDARAARRALR